MSLREIYCAGLVQRYHTNPWLAHVGQSNAEHQGFCIQMLLHLFPHASSRLVFAVAFHDIGERLAADLPAGIGRSFPVLKAAHKYADKEARAAMLGHDPVSLLNPEELRILTFIDQLEPIYHMLVRAPHARHYDGWKQSMEKLIREAHDLLGEGVAHDLRIDFDALMNGDFSAPVVDGG